MTFGSTVRKPPRRRSARRIAAALSIVLVLAAVGPGRADAYRCDYADGTRVATSDCTPPKPKKKKHVPGEPNVVSLAIFVAVLLGVLAIPVSYYRTGAPERE